jgi:hypothetical protein
MHAATWARRTSFSDFSPGSGRTQCRCIARSTGERCRHDAVQGVTACRTHGGTAGAVTRAKHREPRFRRAASGTVARATLARIAIAAGIMSGEGLVADGRSLCQRL